MENWLHCWLTEDEESTAISDKRSLELAYLWVNVFRVINLFTSGVVLLEFNIPMVCNLEEFSNGSFIITKNVPGEIDLASVF